MNINISLCNQENNQEDFLLNLSDKNFIELWQDYLQLPLNRRVYTPKEVINAIDSKLDPNYNTNDILNNFLDSIKKLEDICIMALVNQDTICVRIIN